MHPSVSRRTFLSQTLKATLAAAALPVAAAAESSRPGRQADAAPPATGSERTPPSAPAAPGAALAEFQFHNDNTLGTSLDLTVVCRGKAQSEAVLKVVLDEIERLRKILSTRDPASEISRLAAATGPVKCSPELLEVLEACQSWHDRSAGAFNAQLGDLIDLWTEAAKANEVPEPAALAALARRLATPMWKIDKAAGTVEHTGDFKPNGDALAKGYIVEKAAAAAMAKDPTLAGLLLDIGGDIRVMGSAVEAAGAPWLIGVADPKESHDNALPIAQLKLRDAAIATSGNYARYFVIGSKLYSHILDPRTGRPVEDVAGATAVAPDAATADALATILCVLGPAEGLRLASTVKGAECFIVSADGKTYASPGWKTVAVTEGPLPTPAFVATTSGEGWPAGHAVNVTLELAAKGKRPYVAVWVEDAAGAPVRTLTVWGTKSKYQKDLQAWWNLYKTRREVIKAVSRATRRAGRYELAWDGRDDNGRPVKPGPYTIRVEAAQEDGPRKKLSGVIACDKGPATVDIPGTTLVKGVSIAFGPATAKQQSE